MFESLGKDYAEYAISKDFGFEYCDVIGSRAQAFYQRASIGLQAQLALAMLQLGTSHNRWYVERLFMQMASPSISNELAERIIVELNVQEIDFEAKVSHVEISIGVNRIGLHPILLDRLQGNVE